MPANTLSALPEPPLAEQRAHEVSHHGVTWSDPWHWLRDADYPVTDDPEVLKYLAAENRYFQQWLSGHTAFTDRLFEEFKGRVDETETSVPWVDTGYEYKWLFREGEEYRTHLRKPVAPDASAYRVFLDEPALAKGHDFFDLGDYAISPDNRYLAYSVDTEGDERYEVYVMDLHTGDLLPDRISNASNALLFTRDNSLIYGALEAEKWRVASVNRHRLGTASAQDSALFTEQDDAYFLEFGQTSDRQYLLLATGQGNITEYWVLPQADLDARAQLMASRDRGFKYQVDHAHGRFWILANDQHVNFRLASVGDDAPGYQNWTTVKPGSDQVYLKGLQTFADFLAIEQAVDGLEQLVLADYQGRARPIEFEDAVFAASFGNNPQFQQPHVRVNYQSMVTPPTVFDYEVARGRLVERKVQKIPSGYDKSRYRTQRLKITARDGTEVPVSLMYNKGLKPDGTHPLHLYGYGAYGMGMAPGFSSTRLSLVDRGVIYAIAHVRGGDEMGYQWYLDGKLDKRNNTFNDFIDVAEGLISQGYARRGNISISGRSAGGELMGAAVLRAPHLWSSAILGVPFVDVLNTMLDASLPLTPPEWQEWGNPLASKADFELIRGYSPYDNIEARAYPPMMVTGGLYDPRVTYWEPAKWTASMRHHKTDSNLLIMRMNMGAGHFANSGRYGRLRDYAEEYTFTLLSHGIDE